jgi:hypothetical protein
MAKCTDKKAEADCHFGTRFLFTQMQKISFHRSNQNVGTHISATLENLC